MAHFVTLLASEHLVRGLLMKINTQPTLHADAVLCFLQYLSADKEDLCTNHCLFFFCFILPLQSNRLSWSHPMLNLPLKRMLFNTHKHTYAHTIGHSHTHRHTRRNTPHSHATGQTVLLCSMSLLILQLCAAGGWDLQFFLC